MLHRNLLREQLKPGQDYSFLTLYELLAGNVTPEEALRVHHRTSRNSRELGRGREKVDDMNVVDRRITSGRRELVRNLLRKAVEDGVLKQTGSRITESSFHLVADAVEPPRRSAVMTRRVGNTTHPTGITHDGVRKLLGEQEWFSFEELVKRIRLVTNEQAALNWLDPARIRDGMSRADLLEAAIVSRLRRVLVELAKEGEVRRREEFGLVPKPKKEALP